MTMVTAMEVKAPSQALVKTNAKLSKTPQKPLSVTQARAQVIQHLSEAKLEILKSGRVIKPS